MKKFFVLVILTSFSLLSFSQSKGIFYDKTDDGIRTIITDNENLYTKFGEGCDFYLVYAYKDDIGLYNLVLSLRRTKTEQFDVGRKLLIKFDDGSTMELSNSNRIGRADYTYTVLSGGTLYYMKPCYQITQEQIETICSKNPIKIRIENNMEYYDRNIKSKKFSQGLKKQYDNIKYAMTIDNDIHEGF